MTPTVAAIWTAAKEEQGLPPRQQSPGEGNHKGSGNSMRATHQRLFPDAGTEGSTTLNRNRRYLSTQMGGLLRDYLCLQQQHKIVLKVLTYGLMRYDIMTI